MLYKDVSFTVVPHVENHSQRQVHFPSDREGSGFFLDLGFITSRWFTSCVICIIYVIYFLWGFKMGTQKVQWSKRAQL